MIFHSIMLVTFSPVVAADNVSAPPTIEEILNDFHQKAFETQMTAEADAPSTYSRGSSAGSKTLEQETVDTLNAAGYTAYNVTGDNYDSLESTLKTDFSAMGLSKNSSYIVVISGEDRSNSNNPNSRLGNIPEYDLIDPGGGGLPSFEYTYNGKTYSMRYVTVTTADKSALTRQLTFGVDRDQNSSKWGTIFNAVFSYSIDTVVKAPITSMATLLSDVFPSGPPSTQSYSGFVITGATTWALRYIEIYNGTEWVSAQCSEYAVTTWRPQHCVYNEITEDHDYITGDDITFKTYSEYYTDSAQCKALAAEYYSIGSRLLDFTNDIVIRLENLDDERFYINDNGYSFRQTHWSFYDYDF